VEGDWCVVSCNVGVNDGKPRVMLEIDRDGCHLGQEQVTILQDLSIGHRSITAPFGRNAPSRVSVLVSAAYRMKNSVRSLASCGALFMPTASVETVVGLHP